MSEPTTSPISPETSQSDRYDALATFMKTVRADICAIHNIVTDCSIAMTRITDPTPTVITWLYHIWMIDHQLPTHELKNRCMQVMHICIQEGSMRRWKDLMDVSDISDLIEECPVMGELMNIYPEMTKLIHRIDLWSSLTKDDVCNYLMMDVLVTYSRSGGCLRDYKIYESIINNLCGMRSISKYYPKLWNNLISYIDHTFTSRFLQYVFDAEYSRLEAPDEDHTNEKRIITLLKRYINLYDDDLLISAVNRCGYPGLLIRSSNVQINRLYGRDITEGMNNETKLKYIEEISSDFHEHEKKISRINYFNVTQMVDHPNECKVFVRNDGGGDWTSYPPVDLTFEKIKPLTNHVRVRLRDNVADLSAECRKIARMRNKIIENDENGIYTKVIPIRYLYSQMLDEMSNMCIMNHDDEYYFDDYYYENESRSEADHIMQGEKLSSLRLEGGK